MSTASNRDNFSSTTKTILAKRSAYKCSICKCITVAPSFESIVSTNNIGVAAHITAASKTGPRYDKTMSSAKRSSISNAIWLCQTHAKMIDNDTIQWTVKKLELCKKNHEEYIFNILGIPKSFTLNSISNYQISIREYAFINIGELIEPYREFIKPILQDKNLKDNSDIGVLMCGSLDNEPAWTFFVDQTCLRWLVEGSISGFNIGKNFPSEKILGQIPGWPDDFFEFLEAIVHTKTRFIWKKSENDYLVLAQTKN
ncbi:hypothetical protein LPB90_10545 [Chryseobacterium sp. LC2016-29]|uniref:hypothetical protein n=1 Tax=Chryseobacterium sp. LC2016-29 TaxID=2897331 RepID=UPI001E2DD522|nr:hypothetical protein [Chryseobacterium sp. LC2016-29]MCD0478898.1 hypothetical protein [Chryseobacterium sp. LC2016-29]